MAAQRVGSDDRFRINTPAVSHETVEGETLIIDLENGNYFSLLGVGADIWLLTGGGATVGTVVEAIQRGYTGNRGEIELAVAEFLAGLLKERLIVQLQGDQLKESVEVDVRLATGSDGKGRVFEPPVVNKYTDMQDLLLMDPVHEVDPKGWPTPKAPARE